MTKLFFFFIAVIGCGIFLGIVLLPSSPPVEPVVPPGPRESRSSHSAESATAPARPEPETYRAIRTVRKAPAETGLQSTSPGVATAATTPTPALPTVVPLTEVPSGAIVRSLPALLQANASTNYSRAMENLAAADSPFKRYLALGQAGKWAFVFGQAEAARAYAGELLSLDEGFKSEPWRDGGAVHEGNLVLGQIALQEGRTDEAREYLLKAGSSTGSPVLGSFGPNMTLARDLLQKGESQAVLNYFEQCRRFWSMGDEKLKRWAEDVTAGRMPDFGANLVY